ncbi:MAG TPA: GNAT family N-acetyltransferase [Bacteroidia bacterium]|jgi:ribosomal-protein-alanine N-acetyltransferase|nr:GNAT family N-acetyltransferase [Bacteroidia bacterium]
MNYKYEDNLQTQRLTTRFLTLDDFKTWAKFMGDQESVEFFPKANFKTPEDRAIFWIEKQMTRYKENKYGLQVLLDKNTGEFIGQCGLLLQEVDSKLELEVGYHIFRNNWKKGYAIEAASIFKEYGFKNNQAESIISIIHSQNIRSQNVAIKNGMKKDKETKWMDLNVFIFRTIK